MRDSAYLEEAGGYPLDPLRALAGEPRLRHVAVTDANLIVEVICPVLPKIE